MKRTLALALAAVTAVSLAAAAAPAQAATSVTKTSKVKKLPRWFPAKSPTVRAVEKLGWDQNTTVAARLSGSIAKPKDCRPAELADSVDYISTESVEPYGDSLMVTSIWRITGGSGLFATAGAVDETGTPLVRDGYHYRQLGGVQDVRVRALFMPRDRSGFGDPQDLLSGYLRGRVVEDCGQASMPLAITNFWVVTPELGAFEAGTPIAQNMNSAYGLGIVYLDRNGNRVEAS